MIFKPPIEPDIRVLNFPIYVLPISNTAKDVFRKMEKYGSGFLTLTAPKTINDLINLSKSDFYSILARSTGGLNTTPRKIIDEIKPALALYGLHLKDSNFTTYDFPIDMLDINKKTLDKLKNISVFKNSNIETLGDISIITPSTLTKKHNISDIWKLKCELAKFGIFFERKTSKSENLYNESSEKLKQIKAQAIEERYQKILKAFEDDKLAHAGKEASEEIKQNTYHTQPKKQEAQKLESQIAVKTLADEKVNNDNKDILKEQNEMANSKTNFTNTYFSADESTLSLHIETLGFSNNLLKKIKNIGISTIGELAQYGKPKLYKTDIHQHQIRTIEIALAKKKVALAGSYLFSKKSEEEILAIIENGKTYTKKKDEDASKVAEKIEGTEESQKQKEPESISSFASAFAKNAKTTAKKQEFMRTPLEELGLPSQIIKAIKGKFFNQIKTAADLAKFDKAELVRAIGLPYTKEIEEYLNGKGIILTNKESVGVRYKKAGFEKLQSDKIDDADKTTPPKSQNEESSDINKTLPVDEKSDKIEPTSANDIQDSSSKSQISTNNNNAIAARVRTCNYDYIYEQLMQNGFVFITKISPDYFIRDDSIKIIKMALENFWKKRSSAYVEFSMNPYSRDYYIKLTELEASMLEDIIKRRQAEFYATQEEREENAKKAEALNSNIHRLLGKFYSGNPTSKIISGGEVKVHYFNRLPNSLKIETNELFDENAMQNN